MSVNQPPATSGRVQSWERDTGEAMSPAAALAQAQDVIVASFRDKPVRVYEAGGGSVSVLPLDRFKGHRITVVDIDEVQLGQNRYADERVLGNIETHRFPPNSFDLVVCHNVLEHLEAADQAVRRFYEALAPGGLVFISAPNPASFTGMVTKYTPHWFHVWVYRVLLRDKNAGKPGQHPFRTVYHPIVNPQALLKFSNSVGFEVLQLNQFVSKNLSELRQSRPLFARSLEYGIAILDVLTLRRLPLLLGDYHVILRKPG
ncbi:MAG TPA: class I SAM-dependent methyltransferase [Devosiaceae bacterium]|nr:class I SAM-dependent methyltransferase [Devosiaceae bacterium]